MALYNYDFYSTLPTGAITHVVLGAHLSVEDARSYMKSWWKTYGMKPGQFGGWKSICAVRTSGVTDGPPKMGVVTKNTSYDPGSNPVECFNGYQFYQPSPGPVVVTCGEGFEWVTSQQKCLLACPPGVQRDANGNCVVIAPYPVNKTFRQPGYDQVFAMPVAPPFAGPRVVRWVDPGGIPKPKPMPMARLWPGTPAPYVLLSGALGQAVTDLPSITQAKAALFAWNQSAQILSNYGTSLEDVNPNWTARDGIILHAFSVWWNKSGKSPQLPPGDVASLELTAAHVAALQQFGTSQIPPGWIPPPTSSLPTPAQGQAQAACALACEQKYGITSGALNPTALATCLQQCAQGTPTQPTLPTPPTQPTLPPAQEKKSNTGLLVVGGLAAAAVVGVLVMSSRSKGLAENPKKRLIGPGFKEYGHGVSIRYSPVNQAWLIMWHKQVLGVASTYEGADRRAEELVRSKGLSTNPRGKRNDSEREMWVLNDEGLYNDQRRSRMSMRAYIRENREMIDEAIDRVLNRGPAEKTWRDY